jgi:hypothetical protein
VSSNPIRLVSLEEEIWTHTGTPRVHMYREETTEAIARRQPFTRQGEMTQKRPDLPPP